MIFTPSVDNSIFSVCLNWAMFRKKIGREKEVKFFSGVKPLTFSKLKGKSSYRNSLFKK